MESEDILLRQPSHMQTVIPLLNDQKFAEAFGDIKIVFVDGNLFYYINRPSYGLDQIQFGFICDVD